MEHFMNFNKEDFLKTNPDPRKKKEPTVSDDLIRDCVELTRMGYPVKIIAKHAGVGYDVLLRATKEQRTRGEKSEA
jgi:hypothetical protein